MPVTTPHFNLVLAVRPLTATFYTIVLYCGCTRMHLLQLARRRIWREDLSAWVPWPRPFREFALLHCVLLSYISSCPLFRHPTMLRAAMRDHISMHNKRRAERPRDATRTYITNNNWRRDPPRPPAAPHNSQEIFPYPLQTAVPGPTRSGPRGTIYAPVVHALTARWLSRALGIYIFTIARRKCF